MMSCRPTMILKTKLTLVIIMFSSFSTVFPARINRGLETPTLALALAAPIVPITPVQAESSPAIVSGGQAPLFSQEPVAPDVAAPTSSILQSNISGPALNDKDPCSNGKGKDTPQCQSMQANPHMPGDKCTYKNNCARTPGGEKDVTAHSAGGGPKPPSPKHHHGGKHPPAFSDVFKKLGKKLLR